MLHKWCAEQNRQLLHYSTKPYGSAKYIGHCISSLVFKESPGGHLLITVLILNCANKFIYLWMVQRTWYFYDMAYSNSEMGYFIKGCLHRGGGPQIGEITCGGSPHLSCKRDHIKMRDYMDKRVTPPKRVSSPTWGPPSTCKQALNVSTIRIETVSSLS